MSKREKFSTRSIILLGPQQLTLARALLDHVPLDQDRPIEFLIREQVKKRGLDANSRYWVGPLKDIAEQAWYKGQQFTAEVWHETYKRLYLPEEFDPELCLQGYTKWAFDREGERLLIGSTTQLTKRGFAMYLEQVTADGAGMGVQFSASPNEAP